MKTALRTVFLSLVTLALAGLSVETTSAASGTLTIGQMSRSEVVGAWVLKLPTGGTIESTDPYVSPSMYTLKNAPAGTYTITFTAPSGADSTVTLTTGGKKETFTTLAQTFTLVGSDDVRVIAEYNFDGVIKVQSEPSGVKFRITGTNGIDMTGTTPAQFSNLPPLPYSVYYSMKEGCITPKPQHRDLSEDRPLIFSMTYICDDMLVKPVQPKKEKPEETGKPVRGDAKRKANVAHLEVETMATQTEILPGGTVRVTLRISNPSDKVIRDIEIMHAFDPSQLSLAGDLPKSGIRRDNMAVWLLNDIQPNERWTVTLEMNVADTLVDGASVDLNTTVQSPDLQSPVGDIASLRVMTDLPQTGGAFDLLFVIMTGTMAAGLLRAHKYGALKL